MQQQQSTTAGGPRRIRVARLLATDHAVATPMMQASASKGRVDTSLRITCARMPGESKVTLAKTRRLYQPGHAACGSCHNRAQCSSRT